MQKLSIFATVLLFGATTGGFADHYATKADYRAGKLTPSPAREPRGGDDCDSMPPPICPTFFNPPQVGDTTGGVSDIDLIPVACNGNYASVAGPDHIYHLNSTGSGITTVALFTPDDDYDPSIYALSICGDGDSCVAGSDSCFARTTSGNPCGPASGESFGLSVGPGLSYFVYVDSFYTAGNPSGRDSGPYSLTFTGPCPVELLHFTVE